MSLLGFVKQPTRHNSRMIALRDVKRPVVCLHQTRLTFSITGIPASLRTLGANWECLKASRLYLENEANMATAGVCPSVGGLGG